MQDCGFPVIPEYLARQDWPAAQLTDVKVTHVWTQDRVRSEHIAQSSLIDHVVDAPEQMLGRIDALLLARDDAENHLTFAAPFLKAGLPVYVDKPVALSIKAFEELHALQRWPGQIFSCSAFRYAPEMCLLPEMQGQIGSLRLITGTTPRYWDTYAIHLIDPLLKLVGTHCRPLRLFSVPISADGRTVGFKMGEGGPEVILSALGSTCSGPAQLRLHGMADWIELTFRDSFTAFRNSLAAFLYIIRKKPAATMEEFNRRAVEIIELGRN